MSYVVSYAARLDISAAVLARNHTPGPETRRIRPGSPRVRGRFSEQSTGSNLLLSRSSRGLSLNWTRRDASQQPRIITVRSDVERNTFRGQVHNGVCTRRRCARDALPAIVPA